MSQPIPLVRPVLSNRATTFYAAFAAVSFSATSSAPTPLYHLYQQTLGLQPLTVTLIFASYAFAIVAAFLTVARLSDYVGRRPMAFVALAVNAIALTLFIDAGSAGQLIVARVVQGAATGIALTTFGAMILDTDRENGAIYNSVTAFIGLMAGSLLAGALVAWAPLPTELVYIVLLAVTLGEIVVLLFVPETAATKTGAFGAIIPRVRIPAKAVPAMIRLLPLNVAAWALGGFYLSLMPSLVATATQARSPFTGAAVVSALMLSAAATVFAFRSVPPTKLLAIAGIGLIIGIAATLVGVALQSVPLMFLGTVVAGIGFGSAYSGMLRALLPIAAEHERAALLSAYFVESYVAFALPAIAAGMLAPVLGLVTTAYLYGAVLIAMTALSLVLGRVSQREAPHSAATG